MATLQILSDAGIVPSNSATYTSKEILAALSASAGADPVLLCSSSTLSSIYYGFYVTGPLLNEDFTPTTVTGEDSTCPSSGISYPVKVSQLTSPLLPCVCESVLNCNEVWCNHHGCANHCNLNCESDDHKNV